ncbi:hypothetical protein [Clostridium sp. DJ247]|uniref:hypothetical protein n=1 Tax=Clostridium sp. DJ247 TaxID=2726188 RepID=UPI001628630E|nr:hypothetical protein [Clostridium sp. DJ247]MBC2582721.1 hypothetical protein [Clostridium sp. DJ247]
MRRTISFLGWIGVSLTILTLILTILTTYQFTYIRYFDSYYTLQWCICLTMIIWAMRMFDSKLSLRSAIYPIACSVIAIATIFFMYMKVF